MIHLSWLSKLLERWEPKERVSHLHLAPDVPCSVLKLKYQDRAYRAEAKPRCISIQSLPDGDWMDFSTDEGAEHTRTAQNAFNGDDWGLASLQELFDLYEAAQIDRAGDDLGEN